MLKMININIREVEDFAISHFRLDPHGTHGLSHWRKVLKFGLVLSEETEACKAVIAYFAYFHDIMRKMEYADFDHGRRSVEFIKNSSEAQALIHLDGNEMDNLFYAIACHADGLTEANTTVQTCWDADRLDLFRVGIRRHSIIFCTQQARSKNILDWAEKTSLSE